MTQSSPQRESHRPWQCADVEELIGKLRAYRDERHVAEHPFTQAIATGRISREGIVAYLGQFCVYVERGGKAWLPWLLGNIPVGLEYRQAKNVLLDNLYGEFRDPADHVDLLLDMAVKAFGADRDELYHSTLLPETVAFMHVEEHYAHHRPWVEAMVALGFGLETQSPRYFTAIRDGLVEHYGLEDTFYYDMHIKADVEHGDSIEMLMRAYGKPENAEAIWRAATESIDAYQLWHDGLYRAYISGKRL
ncbi:MAG TPA: iron-containing redox enzyme family protein [Blastocatellia bacterium]|nr:iron-containing redox enzyme family protein [Blastocatellia bacterium]